MSPDAARSKRTNWLATALIVAGAALLAVGLALAYRNRGAEAMPPSLAAPTATPVRISAARPALAWPTPRPLKPTATARPQPTARSVPPTATPVPTPTPPGPPPANAPPDRIVIPAIGLDAPVVPVGRELTEEGLVWQVADYAAGWHNTSAYPGHRGNTVLSGHNNIKGQVFRYLVNLEPGDEVILYVGETAYRYLVTEKHLLEEKGMPEDVRRRNARWIAATEDERLTLVTCWPYTSNTHRLIVVAKPFWEVGKSSHDSPADIRLRGIQ